MLDGAQVLSNVAPVPADTIRWLKDQVASSVGAGQGFRNGLESWLTPHLLSAEWARLRSVSGLPVNVPYQGSQYPASLRLTLTATGPGDPEMELMPDGAPVTIQRWMLGVSETGSTATTTELRSLNQALQLTWPVTHTDLLDVSVTPRGTITYGQLSTQVTATQADQLEQRIRSRGKSSVFNFTMNWELRLGDPVSELFAGRRPQAGQGCSHRQGLAYYHCACGSRRTARCTGSCWQPTPKTRKRFLPRSACCSASSRTTAW